MTLSAKFNIGQIVHHARFDYRGVIIDVDPHFSGTDTWYDNVAKSRPPKDQPWYRVLVDGSECETYVAERHLEVDQRTSPVSHPALTRYFAGYQD
ncbi:MAG: heat shock protein HspQ, partial [Exilibacterium sp.]